MAALFDIKRFGFLTRPAGEADWKAFRMLLPYLHDVSAAFVAVDGRHQLVIGAAGMSREFRARPLAGPGVDICVIPPCRRQGIAKKLLDEVKTAARSRGARALYATQRAEIDSEPMKAWNGLGFAVCETVREHIMPLNRFEPRLAPLVERLFRQNRVPADARIIPLYRSELGAVLRLHLDHMGGDRGDLYRKLRSEGIGGFHPHYSRVLLIGNRVMGCILAHRKDAHTAVVDANIVDPEVRGGWANLWLKLEATRGAIELGIRTFEFTTFDHYADTRRFTEKLGGTTVRAAALMYLPLFDTDTNSTERTAP